MNSATTPFQGHPVSSESARPWSDNLSLHCAVQLSAPLFPLLAPPPCHSKARQLHQSHWRHGEAGMPSSKAQRSAEMGKGVAGIYGVSIGSNHWKFSAVSKATHTTKMWASRACTRSEVRLVVPANITHGNIGQAIDSSQGRATTQDRILLGSPS